MVFNSFGFLAFFAVVAPLYWLLPHRAQILLLLTTSYAFYAAWHTEYALLLAAVTLLNYSAGLYLGDTARSPRRRHLALLASLAVNLGVLFAFKYWGFFGSTVEALSSWLGQPVRWPVLNLLLPVGISFYTFRTISYTIDVYRGQQAAERSLPRFALFVSFFPLLLAGPIERAAQLLPQIASRRRLVGGELALGAKLLLVGLFKKMVIGDNLARIVTPVYAAGSAAEPVEYVLATYAYAFQIYADFSGYSDIAVGVAKIIGFDLTVNFRTPYLATSPTEFWKRWHISLSTWLRDYLFLKLGYVFSRRLDGIRWLGLRQDVWAYAAAAMTTMTLAGLWHGASWTFVAWGASHGLFLAIDRALAAPLRRLTRTLPAGRALLRGAGVLLTFHLVCLSWVYFRASDLAQASAILGSISEAVWSGDAFGRGSRAALSAAWSEQRVVWLLTATGIAAELLLGTGNGGVRGGALSASLRGVAYAVLLAAILAYGVYGANVFIYFQF